LAFLSVSPLDTGRFVIVRLFINKQNDLRDMGKDRYITMKTTMLSLYCIFIISELFHIIKHSKVLFRIGRPLPEEWYWRHRDYFIFDLLSGVGSACLIGLTAYLNAANVKTSFLVFLAVIAMGHGFLHALYIEGWKLRRPRVQKIIAWSTNFSIQQRKQMFGNIIHYGHTMGTAYDIATHIVITSLLFRDLFFF